MHKTKIIALNISGLVRFFCLELNVYFTEIGAKYKADETTLL